MQKQSSARSKLFTKIQFLVLVAVLAGCAGPAMQSRAPEPGRDGFVEIDNPTFTMTPGAPPTIWVPREYVEKGPPRGRVLAKRGYQSIAQ